MEWVRAHPVNKSFLRYSVFCVLLPWAAGSWAADVSTEPQADLRIEQNDNLDLAPGGSPDSEVEGYLADLSVLFDIRTPRGTTALRPRIRAQEYPDREDFEKVEAFFDMRSAYRWERSTFILDADLSRQDVYNNETPSGVFDPLDPGGGDPDSGSIVIGEVRTAVGLAPTFEHRVSERTSIGVGADLRAARFDAPGDVETKTDYDFGVLRGYLSWALGPRTDFKFDAYGSRYAARDDSRETDAVGGGLGVTHRWSATDGIEATVFYERNETTVFFPFTVEEENTSNLGGELTAYRKLEVSDWRLSIGREFIPTGDRGKSELTFARAQYNRRLSERLSLHAAARYDSRTSISDLGFSDDRDYARVDLSLRWFLTPTWYIGGGYAYIWEDRQQAPDSADNNKFFINIGYRALSRHGGPAVIN
jgi:hypothetical protein